MLTRSSEHSKKLPPSTGQILSTCVVFQDASAPAQFKRARSGDKDEGESTVLKWPLESVLVGEKYFVATFSTVFVSRLRIVNLTERFTRKDCQICYIDEY